VGRWLLGKSDSFAPPFYPEPHIRHVTAAADAAAVKLRKRLHRTCGNAEVIKHVTVSKSMRRL
jgi:hypothetical protein